MKLITFLEIAIAFMMAAWTIFVTLVNLNLFWVTDENKEQISKITRILIMIGGPITIVGASMYFVYLLMNKLVN